MIGNCSATTLVMFALINSCLAIVGCQTVKTKPVFRPNLTYEPPHSTKNQRAALPGRYIGYYRPDDSPYKIPVVLDLLAEKTKADVTRYQGFVRLVIGGFTGEEFRVEHYPQIVFNHKTQTFSSSAVGNQLTLTNAKLKAKSIITGKIQDLGRTTGDFLVIYAGARKKIELATLINKVFPDRKVFPQVAGQYAGTCGETPAKFFLDHARWDHHGGKNAGFLANYRTYARLGTEDKVRCRNEQICVKRTFHESVLDISRNRLTLEADGDQLACDVLEGKLQCGSKCAFIRDGDTAGAKNALSFVANRQERNDHVSLSEEHILRKQIDFEGAVAGEYFGYLFNETTLKHQLYRLKVEASMEREEGMQKKAAVVSGIGTMFFGSGETNEFSVNKFRGEFYNETGPAFVFRGDGDQVIQVNRWGREGMRAILYSKAFGRVGTLELSRTSIPGLPADSSPVRQLSGNYLGSHHRVTLLAQPNVSDSGDNYFPLVVRGYVQDRANPEKRIVVTDLVYDAYAGRVSMLLEDGRLISGREVEEGFQLNWQTSAPSGEALEAPQPELFRFEPDTAPGKTAINVLDALHDAGAKKL